MAESVKAKWKAIVEENKLPTLKSHRDECLKVIGRSDAALSDIAPIVARDPCLTATILSKVNSVRSPEKRHILNIVSAINLIGEANLRGMLRMLPVIEDSKVSLETKNIYKSIFSESYSIACQAENLARKMGDHSPGEVKVAGLIRNIGELFIVLFGDEEDFKLLDVFFDGSEPLTESENVTSEDKLRNICTTVFRTLGLPELALSGLTIDNVSVNYRASCIHRAYQLVKLTRYNWYGQRVKTYISDISESFDIPIEPLIQSMHYIAVDSLRFMNISSVFPNVSCLIDIGPELLRFQPAKNKSFSTNIIQHLKSDLKAVLSKKSSGAVILKYAMKRLKSSLKDFPVSMMILNTSNMLTIKPINLFPLDTDSLINPDKSSLLRSLLNKPQAIWVNAGNYDKFGTCLSEAMPNILDERGFFLMSIFDGNRPIGILYMSGDRYQLNSNLYSLFKKYCSIINQALILKSQTSVKKNKIQTAQSLSHHPV